MAIDTYMLTLYMLVARSSSGPLFTKRTDVLPQDLLKSLSRKIGCYNDPTALKFERHLGSNAFRVIWKVYIRIPPLRDFTRSCGTTSVRLVNRGPGMAPAPYMSETLAFEELRKQPINQWRSINTCPSAPPLSTPLMTYYVVSIV